MADLTGIDESLIALVLLALLFVAFALEKYPPDVTAAGAAGLFIVLGLVPTDEVMAVFSNSAPITIAAMFVVSGALVRTGVLDALANLVIGRAQSRPVLAVGIFLLATIAASAFMNNTPVVLVLIPVVIRLATSLNMAPTRLLIPLSYAAILGGTCTLIGTSTNLLVDGIAQESGLEPFSIFEIAPVGIAVTVATGRQDRTWRAVGPGPAGGRRAGHHRDHLRASDAGRTARPACRPEAVDRARH